MSDIIIVEPENKVLTWFHEELLKSQQLEGKIVGARLTFDLIEQLQTHFGYWPAGCQIEGIIVYAVLGQNQISFDRIEE